MELWVLFMKFIVVFIPRFELIFNIELLFVFVRYNVDILFLLPLLLSIL